MTKQPIAFIVCGVALLAFGLFAGEVGDANLWIWLIMPVLMILSGVVRLVIINARKKAK